MTFTELCSLYELYKKMNSTPAPATPATPAQTPVTNNDLMAMLQAMQIPAVHSEAPKPESIDDVICRIAGIETNKKK